MDWDDFEARARTVIPRQELKPRRCWIGVLSHEKTPQDAFGELDFVWMIGHLKVYETYQSRHTDVQFQLKFKDAQVDKSDTIKTFLAPDANIVLFLACLPQDNHGQQQAAAQSPSPVQARRSSPSSSFLARRAKDEPEDYDAPLPPPPSAVLPLAQPGVFSVATVGTEPTPNHASLAMDHDVEDAAQSDPNDYQKGGPTTRLTVPQSTVTAIKNENIPSNIAHPYMDENIADPVLHPHMD
ncbi:hypothetical protein BDU57DRAFT_572044 [Ampelomyces quisqualis]|uniref:Uncharacterized protein n=1 Tax=Ampelomyces quisqualis TaxID=50730 RepID=A0A6A5QW79_AMPQU|nr:hypothetical protein BDU57DRAFT_572044 [Ampelomyces quisqualis]